MPLPPTPLPDIPPRRTLSRPPLRAVPGPKQGSVASTAQHDDGRSRDAHRGRSRCGSSGPGHGPGKQSKPGASRAALLPWLQTLRIPLASGAPCTARRAGVPAGQRQHHPPGSSIPTPPPLHAHQEPPNLVSLEVYPTVSPQTLFSSEPQKLAPSAELRGQSVEEGEYLGGRGDTTHFSQVHSWSLGGIRHATPCPRASRLRWAQKSWSLASSSSPRARQCGSCRNRFHCGQESPSRQDWSLSGEGLAAGSKEGCRRCRW